MPLSDHEKRLLDEIEQTLRIDDPALASSLRAARPQPRHRTMILLAVVSFLVGFGLQLLGLRLDDSIGTALGVLGFLALVGCGEAIVRIVDKVRHDRDGLRRRGGDLESDSPGPT